MSKQPLEMIQDAIKEIQSKNGSTPSVHNFSALEWDILSSHPEIRKQIEKEIVNKCK